MTARNTLRDRLPLRVNLTWALNALSATLAAMLLWPAFAHAVEVWSADEEFSYGFLIVPIAVGLVWWRRRELRRSIGPGSVGGLAVLAPAVAAYLLAYRIGINALAGFAAIPLLWGLAVYVWGWRAGRVLAFPVGFLVFGLGLFRGLLSSVGFALQGITANGAHAFGQAIGLSVHRDGLVLSSDRYQFVVAQACSGMSSLLSLLALASLLIYLARGPLLGRFATLLSVVPLVIVANITRVTLVLLVADRFGQDVAVGFFHGASSLVLFGIATGGLLLVSWIVRCKPLNFASSF